MTLLMQFNFLLEDADALGPAANWWHPRVKLVDQWLKDEANRTDMPDDGSEEVPFFAISRSQSRRE